MVTTLPITSQLQPYLTDTLSSPARCEATPSSRRRSDSEVGISSIFNLTYLGLVLLNLVEVV